MLHSLARDFGESLVDRRVLSRDALEDALAESARTGQPLPTVLKRRELVGGKDLAAALAFALGLRFVDLSATRVQPEALVFLPEPVARANLAIPVELDGDRLVVACAEPANHAAVAAVVDAVCAVSGLEVVPAAAEREEVLAALDAAYGRSFANSDSGLVARSADEQLLTLVDHTLAREGSDLHLSAGNPPLVRVLGELRRVEGHEALSGSRIREMVYSVLTQRQVEEFERSLELDTSITFPGRTRVRMTLFVQRDSIAAALRMIPFDVIPFERLGLPEVVKDFSRMTRGLVLVTGPTGSGKSTTLASLIDVINRERPAHVITIEEPIEFVHVSKEALVNQRDVGQDTHSFAIALRQALRQDPDVVLVGEMRDLETVSTAIAAAETGHLVFATLHTQDTAQTIDRIVDVFPAEQQEQIRVQVAGCIQGIVTQTLVPTVDGRRRVVAAEVLIATPAIRALIRENKVHQVHPMVQSGKRYGMVTLDESLGALVRAGEVRLETALARSRSPEEVRRLSRKRAEGNLPADQA